MFRIDWKLLLPLVLAISCGGPRNRPAGSTDESDMKGPLFLPEDLGDPPGDLTYVRNLDAACAQATANAMPAKRPVDIIVVIDNSGSMTEEITGVENNINKNLATLLNMSGIDYRVIMISKFGDHNVQNVCIGQPLGGNLCPPGKNPPVNTPRYFIYDTEIQSNNSFDVLLETYRLRDVHNLTPNGWSGYLRKEAIKMFVMITDDRPTMLGSQFDFQLRVIDQAQFGTDKKRNYIFHSIVGLKANNPVTKPWYPDDPIVQLKCGQGAENNGEEYQALSILTRGLRFPICEYMNFNGIFQEITKGVIDGTRLACEILMPAPPDMQQIDMDSLVVEYTPSNIALPPSQFKPVAGVNSCAPNSFYLMPAGCGDMVPCERMILCPDTCTTVQKDINAKMRVLYDCIIPSGVRGSPQPTGTAQGQ